MTETFWLMALWLVISFGFGLLVGRICSMSNSPSPTFCKHGYAYRSDMAGNSWLDCPICAAYRRDYNDWPL